MVVVFLFSGVCFGGYGQARHPVYVGVRQCAECHRGKGMGSQFSKWLHSKHSQAYASLSKPESAIIAQYSGVPEAPEASVICLGCHATGAHAEEWEKDDTFFVEDGVQCEKCHGPGSEYMEVMSDPVASAKAGLIMPTLKDCVSCHQDKSSHLLANISTEMGPEERMELIAHPTPKVMRLKKTSELPEMVSDSEFKYAGALQCSNCHDGSSKGYQFSKWRLSQHAQAYSVLTTDKAYEMASSQGIGDPQISTKCLKCHTTVFANPVGGVLDSYFIDEGVGCEACHGAGNKHLESGDTSGFNTVTEAVCLTCHQDAHGKRFDYEEALETIAHPLIPATVAKKTVYKTPLYMAIHPDGELLYVACEASNSVIVVDVQTLKKIDEIPTGRQPTCVAFSPDGREAYITNRLDDTLSIVDVSAGTVLKTIAVGDEPHGLVTDKEGRYLYVANTLADSISVIDTVTFKEVKRLAASRHPWALSRSSDGSKIYATNDLPRFVEFREDSISEVTVLDTFKMEVVERIEVPGANLMLGMDWHPEGEYGLFVANRTKNLVPMTRLIQGWTITNALGVVWSDGSVDQVLLDEPGLCFPDPTDVAISPDGRVALVTSSGSDRVAVVDLEKMIRMIQASSEHARKHVLPNHLGKPVEFIMKHIPTQFSPRGVEITPDGKLAFVANSLDDTLTVIDMDTLEATATIDLGGPEAITKIRFGEQVFHSANNAFRRQFSCHTCHPDGHVNGLTYDIEPDGIGIGPVDNRTLRGIFDTNPFKWEGTNPSLQRQCGARLAVFFTRIQPFTEQELEALTAYICTIPRPPNRHRPLGAPLSDAQRRGKAVFERTVTNDGRAIPKDNRCVSCHFPPMFTDRQIHDVGNEFDYDLDSVFDTPHLSNIYDSAPYLHNGIANTLEEIWTLYNPEDEHGITNDLTKDQLNDLIEYLKTF
jgi:YVTN family beta-propeller protein